MRGRRLHTAPLDELPDGAFVLCDGVPSLVLGARAAPLAAGGLRRRTPRPAGREAALITPPSLVSVLRAGWRPLVPLLHPSAALP